ncbi:hypothetical protein BSKO_04729 [Bryopsis sp. KO-2023]|nr:hypothetical protein BSKO_04729 [Bryopsis sp. KO-2023]
MMEQNPTPFNIKGRTQYSTGLCARVLLTRGTFRETGSHQQPVPGVWRKLTVMASRAELHSLPGVCTKPDASASDFVMNHTMLRIKDPEKSLDFYTRILGMTLMTKLNLPVFETSLFLLGYEKLESVPDDEKERAAWTLGQRGCIELSYSYGTDTDPEFKGYHDGNSEPRGFGHIGICVPNVEAACKRFEELGVEFVKKPNDGKLKNVAFVKDPDGYWIEVLGTDVSNLFP